MPFTPHLHTFEGYSSWVMTTQSTSSPRIWLVAHLDVVPASTALFSPVVKDGRMYGRGVYDIKMAIACYLRLMRELPHADIGMMITTDEEIGGMNGVHRLLEAGYRCDVALLPDGRFNWNLEKEAKGVLQIQRKA